MSSEETEYALHLNPVWKSKANFIINASIDNNNDALKYEQLWTRRINDNEFEVCCIPFFLYDIALGDVVSTVSSGDKKYLLDQVTKRSGRRVFRVWLKGNGDDQKRVLKTFIGMPGVTLEPYSEKLIALDVDGDRAIQLVQEKLTNEESNGSLEFENGER